MSTAGSSSSKADSGSIPPIVNGALHIHGYHFKSSTLSNLGHAGTVDYFYGYKVSTKSPVVAKVSTNAFQLEREYHIMKKLYQKDEASLFLVRPIQFVSLPSGLKVAIYANEGEGLEEHLATELDAASSDAVANGKQPMDQSHTAIHVDDIGEFLRIAIRCTDCLEFIHRHGVVHGEIRPSAFQWAGSDSRLKLWNFSLASKPLDTYLTTEGWRRTANNKETMKVLQNLLVCISPEQTGRTTYSASHRSDIYSLGILFYVLLTGRNPFDGGPIEIINSIVSRKITLVHDVRPDVPEVLSRIIEKMTNKAPDDRYVSAHGVRVDLTECLNRLSNSTSSSDQCIPSFALGTRDVANVFTLPKTIYGRQNVISEMTFFVQRFMGTHKSVQAKLAPASSSTPLAGSSSIDALSDISGSHDSNQAAAKSPSAGLPASHSQPAIDMKDISLSSSKQATTIIGIYGPGGIGKSTVFSAVQATARQYGYVSTIKFDPRTNTPYGGFLGSVSTVLQQILSEPEAEVKIFSEYLKQSLGAQFCNIGLLTDLIPELTKLLNPTDIAQIAEQDDVQADNVEARIRFQNLFVEVLRSISNWHLLTLFLDDLHLADVPSIELIQSLIASRVPLLLCVSYRDQEVTQPLAELLESDGDIHLIEVDALDIDSVTDFLCDTLQRPRDVNREAIQPLAAIVYKRTMGNAFYAAQLIRALARKSLIFFDYNKNEWDFHLKEIESGEGLQGGMMHPDSLLDVSFLVERLKELPRNGQQLLKYASFVGDTFSWATVRDLMLDSDESVSGSDGSLSIISEETDSGSRQGITITLDHPTDVSHAQAGGAGDDDDYYDGASTTTATLCSRHTAMTSTGYHLPPLDHGEGTATSCSSTSCGIDCAVRPSLQKFGTKISSNSSSHSSQDPLSGLQSALQEGYIIPIQSDEFKWCHDRLSQAAMELADPATRSKIHFRVAQRLMKEATPNAFLVADHLLKCMDILKVLENREPYQDLLITAGNRGRVSGAHTVSFGYLMGAIRLSDPNTEWDDEHYTTTLNLYTNAVSLSWVVGEYAATEELLNVLFAKTREPLDRMQAYRIKSKYLFSISQLGDGRDALVDSLCDLTGQDVEFEASVEDVNEAYDQVNALVQKIGIDEIANLGPCEDPTMRGVMTILEEMCTVAYWVGQKITMYYWACQLVKLSLIQGMANVSGSAFTFVGLGYVEMYRQHGYAERIGAVGIALADKYSTIYEKGRIYFLYTLFLVQWRSHCREQLDWYKKSYPICLSAGDRIYAQYSQLHIAVTRFLCGASAADVAPTAEECYNEARSWSSSSNTILMSSSILRIVKALQGRTYTDTPRVFDGDDGFNDEHFLSECYKESSHPEVPHSWYASFKIIALVLYGHMDAAIDVGYFCYENIGSHPCHKHGRVMLCYFSLALIAKLRDNKNELTPEECSAFREQIKVNQQLIDEWAIKSPINYRMYWTFVEAEMAAMDEPHDITRTIELYEDALEQAREGDWYLEITVIHEFAGATYERKGLRNMAYGFIKKAIDLYQERGYHGKVKHLKAKHAKLLHRYRDKKETRREASVQTDALPYLGEQAWSTSSSHDTPNVANQAYTGTTIPPVMHEQTLMTLDIIDMTSILKSSHVMSSEVKFEGLLTSMTTILLDSTGAESCAIIVKGDDGYGISAYGCQGDENKSYDPPRAIVEDDDQISARVIHHTLHTKESIFIYDISQDARFAIGPWFERVGPSSIICMPIVHKATLVGGLFMEGPVGIFTQRHISVLALLCQQMGISIANATLFKSLQQATMSNMRMIEMQKQALEDARRSKEAADRATRLREMFLANMSHEIRTPFSGFYGMITLLAETRLDTEQRELVMVAKESCEGLLQIIDDLLNFSKLQAGKVSLELAPIVIEDVIADVIEMLTGMAMQKQLNVSHMIADNVPTMVVSDSNRLRQILINLLGNAIKFTHEGEVVIRCSVDSAATSKDGAIALRFEVIDTGIGISDEQQKALFVPFSQVDGSTTRKYGGTGLGLSICLQLVELMSGSIGLISVPGQGSNFHFTIHASTCPEQTKNHNVAFSELAKNLGTTRVLVTSRHRSTGSMVQAMMRDTVTVDCVHTIEDLGSLDPKRYTIIIVGIFLVHGPDFDAWTETLDKFFKCAQCVVVMHYPSGIWSRWGSSLLAQQSSSTVMASISTYATDNPQRSQHQKQQDKGIMASAAASKQLIKRLGQYRSDQHHNLIVARISMPFRRRKLVQNLVNILQQRNKSGDEPVSLATIDIVSASSSQPPSPSLPPPPIENASSSKPEAPKRPPMSRKVTSGTGPPISEEEHALFRTKHILIAEDNVVAQKLLYKQLTRLSLNVECANNGIEAIETWKQYPPAYFTLAFFDHHMPKCDGVQATKAIRDMESRADPPIRRLPIIAVTADIQDSARQTCMNAGMDAYITKPVNQKMLLDTLLYYCRDQEEAKPGNDQDCPPPSHN